jgi:hypothetical protein
MINKFKLFNIHPLPVKGVRFPKLLYIICIFSKFSELSLPITASFMHNLA